MSSNHTDAPRISIRLSLADPETNGTSTTTAKSNTNKTSSARSSTGAQSSWLGVAKVDPGVNTPMDGRPMGTGGLKREKDRV